MSRLHVYVVVVIQMFFLVQEEDDHFKMKPKDNSANMTGNEIQKALIYAPKCDREI